MDARGHRIPHELAHGNAVAYTITLAFIKIRACWCSLQSNGWSRSTEHTNAVYAETVCALFISVHQIVSASQQRPPQQCEISSVHRDNTTVFERPMHVHNDIITHFLVCRYKFE